MDWAEAMEFTYTNTAGDRITVVFRRDNGIHQDEAREAFIDFLRAIGYYVEEGR